MKIATLHRDAAVYFRHKVGRGGNGERGEQNALQPILCGVLSMFSRYGEAPDYLHPIFKFRK